MRLTEAVEILNDKKMTVQELASQLDVSKDLLSDVLKENGFAFNNKSKLREYVGDGEPSNLELDAVLIERKNAKRKRMTDKNPRKVRKKSDKGKEEVEVKEELSLTEEEIKYVKKLVQGRSEWEKDFELDYELGKLPPRKPTKKANYEISLDTFESFEEFAKRICEKKRMTRNDLVEIALRKLMKDF